MEAWPQTSDSSSPWRHGRNFWFFFFSMEAWPQTSNPLAILRKLLKTSNPTLFQSSRNLTKTSYENFSNLPILHFWLRNLTKTSYENFQSSTFGYAILRKLLTKTSNPLAILRKLLKTSKLLHSSNPPLLVTQSYENFLQKLLKTSYENFSKLPILHFWLWKLLTKTSQNFQSSTFRYENFQFLQFSLRKLPIPPLLVTKTPLANFWFLDFGYKNLKLPIPPLLVTKTWNFQSSRKLPIPPTWKLEKPYPLPTTSNPPLLGLFFNEILIFSNFPPKCVFWTKLGGFPQICPHFFFFLTKWTFLQKFKPQKVPKMFIILLFLVLLQTFPTFWTISTFCLFQTPKSAYFLQ